MRYCETHSAQFDGHADGRNGTADTDRERKAGAPVWLAPVRTPAWAYVQALSLAVGLRGLVG